MFIYWSINLKLRNTVENEKKGYNMGAMTQNEFNNNQISLTEAWENEIIKEYLLGYLI